VLTLTGSGLINFQSSGIVGGLVRSSDSAAITFRTAGFLDGVELQGVNVSVGTENLGTSTSAGTQVDIRNGLVFDGAVTLGRGGDCEWGVLNFIGSQGLGGTGTVAFADMHNTACDSSERNGLRIAEAETTLTIGPGVTVNGSQGFIGQSTTHAGPAEVDVLGQGRVTANSADSAIVLRSRYWTNDNGEWTASSGGLYLSAVTISNTNVLTLTGSNLIRFTDSGIVGGVVASSDSAAITFRTTGFLDGVELRGVNVSVGTENLGTSTSAGTRVDIRNGFTFDGSITLGRGGDCEWGVLNFIGSQSLGGTGTVSFANMHDTACNNSERNGLRIAEAETTLTIGPGVTVNGSQGFIGYSTFHTGQQGADLINQGQIRSTSSGAILIRVRLATNTGEIAQAGSSLDVIGDLINEGVVRPARNGDLKVTGRYTQTIGGSLEVEVAGTVAGTGFSLLTVTGSADLDGTLAIERSATYTPTAGTYQFLTTQNRTNTFPVVTGRAIGDTHSFSVVYNTTNVQLSVVSGPAGADVINDGPGIDDALPGLYLPLIGGGGGPASQSQDAPPGGTIYLPVMGK